MAQVKLAYIGGGSTRAPGTVASFIRQAANFAGSEIVLQDLDPEKLDLVCRLSRKMAEAQGADLKITATTDRLQGAGRLRRRAVELPPRRVRGALRRRAHSALARRDRAGNPGRGRILHGAAGHSRGARSGGRHGAGLPRRHAVQLHQPGQHRRPGGGRPLAHQGGVAVRGADCLSARDRRAGRTRPRQGGGRDAGPQPRLLERPGRQRRGHLRRSADDSAAGPEAG